MSPAVHRILLRTTGPRLAGLWALAYRAVARAWAAYLVRGERGAAAYARGSLAGDEVLPGLSDIDVAVVLAGDPGGAGRAAERTTARWTRLRRAFRASDLLLDYPMVMEEDELAGSADSSALTFGLNRAEMPAPGPAASYFGPRVSQDRIRMLERPGLYSSTASWRLLAGPERRPRARQRDPHVARIAAWLELCAWWQWAFPVCADPSGPRTASLCVKLIAEPARVWLWLAHGERAERREDVLALACRRLPEEGDAFDRASRLLRTLASSPEPPVAELMPALVRLSSRIAGLIESEIAGAGATKVRLSGADGAELILAHGRWRPSHALPGGAGPPLLPLCDWRSLVTPTLADESFALITGDPADPSLLGAAGVSQPAGPYPALRADCLMVFPAARSRARLRAVKSTFSDPVSFALAGGERLARFPNVPGFCAGDVSARAVAEHRAWLNTAPRGGDGPDAGGRRLATLLSAARAALFAESLDGGAPELPVTVTETVRLLGRRSTRDLSVAEGGLEHYRRFAIHRTPPPDRMLAEMRTLVRQLPSYA